MPADRPTWAATHVGKVRTTNEDRCLVGDWRSEGPNASWRGTLSAEHCWAAVADGMGGHDAGDVASRVALETIAELIHSATSESHVERMLDTANERLFEAMHSGSGRAGTGTTVVGVVLTGVEALLFNIGDSRAYTTESGYLVQQSRDDTLLGSTKGRWPRSHALTQSLGGTVIRLPLRPHIKRLPFTDDDDLLLCSDGLTDMVDDDKIGGILIRNSKHPAQDLVAAALKAGGADNVTAVVIGAVRPDN